MGEIAFVILSCLLGIISTFEFTKITTGSYTKNLIVSILDTIAVVAIICGMTGIASKPSITPWIVFFTVLLSRFVFQLYSKSSDSIKDLALSTLKYFYLGIPLGCMAAIEVNEQTNHLILAIFILIWLNDTGAFITGCSLGKHKLFPRLSPKKTWEGFTGGIIFSIAAGIIFSILSTNGYFGLSNNLSLWIGIAITVSVFATWGDLMESMLKRSLQIKDSGNIMPGHGGILDRIDSLLFVMPACAIYLYFFFYV